MIFLQLQYILSKNKILRNNVNNDLILFRFLCNRIPFTCHNPPPLVTLTNNHFADSSLTTHISIKKHTKKTSVNTKKQLPIFTKSNKIRLFFTYDMAFINVTNFQRATAQIYSIIISASRSKSLHISMKMTYTQCKSESQE